MKTLKNITLTAALIILTANVALANNYRTQRIMTSAGKVIEIISIIEKPIIELIPGYEGFVAELNAGRNFDIKDIEVINEAEVEEDYVVFIIKHNNTNEDVYHQTVEFVKSIYIEEDTVNDLPFNTKEILERNIVKR